MEFWYIGVVIAILLFLIGFKVAKWLVWVLAVVIMVAVFLL